MGFFEVEWGSRGSRDREFTASIKAISWLYQDFWVAWAIGTLCALASFLLPKFTAWWCVLTGIYLIKISFALKFAERKLFGDIPANPPFIIIAARGVQTILLLPMLFRIVSLI